MTRHPTHLGARILAAAVALLSLVAGGLLVRQTLRGAPPPVIGQDPAERMPTKAAYWAAHQQMEAEDQAMRAQNRKHPGRGQ